MFQGTIIRNEPAFRPRPKVLPEYHKFNQGQYDAFASVGALEHIAHDARETSPDETIGFLAGRPFRDEKGFYAIVTDAFTATSARRGPVNVETSFDDERRLVNTLMRQYPIAEKMGWYHSHPFVMPSYSGTDAENQRFWNEAYHLGFLACVDRGSQTVTIHAFRGPEGERLGPPYVSRIDSAPQTATFPMMAEDAPETAARHFAALPFVGRQEPKRSTWMRLATIVVAVTVWSVSLLVGVSEIIDRTVEKHFRAVEWPASRIAAQATPDSPAHTPAAIENSGKADAKPPDTTRVQVSEAPKNSPPAAAKK